MPVEIGLTDGTRLTLADPNMREDDVLQLLTRSGRPDYAQVAGFVSFTTDDGTFRVNPGHVVYVRSV